MEMITGSVERVTFYNPENGYTVLRLLPTGKRVPGSDRDGLITVTGNLPEVAPGEHLRLQGQWVNHPKHGLQFQTEVCEQIMPASLAGMRRYLGSGLVKGIGPRLAERIVAHFGMETLSVIEAQPERLGEVPDIGPKRSRLIYAAWQEQKQVKEIMLFLHSYGVSTNLAVKIYKQYGSQALEIVQNDPYRMAQDIYGVGFKTADKIAQSLGLPADHPSRIEAGVIYLLGQKTDIGHVYFPSESLLREAAELLGVDSPLVSQALERLGSQERIHRETVPFAQTPGREDNTDVPRTQTAETGSVYGLQAVYLTPLYASEVSVSQRLERVYRLMAYPLERSSSGICYYRCRSFGGTAERSAHLALIIRSVC